MTAKVPTPEETGVIRRARRKYGTYLRTQVRAGWTRIKGAFLPNLVAAIFATLSWLLCVFLLHDTNPVYAPIATFLSLGFSRNRNVRRVLEIGLGASMGVLIGGFFGSYLGFGWWQLLVLLALPPLIGRFVDRSEATAYQVAFQGIVVASMVETGSGASGALDRWFQALIGVGVAFLATLVLPTNIVSRPRRYTALALREISRALQTISRGMASGDTQLVFNGRGYLSGAQEAIDDAEAALASGRATAKIKPSAHRVEQEMVELERMLEMAGRLQTTGLILERQTRGMIQEIGNMSHAAPLVKRAADILDEVASDIGKWDRPNHARILAARLAAKLAPDEIAHDANDWQSATVASLVRAIVVDILQLTGLSNAQARSTLSGNQSQVTGQMPIVVGFDGRSQIWGTEHLPAVDLDDASPDQTSRNFKKTNGVNRKSHKTGRHKTESDD